MIPLSLAERALFFPSRENPGTPPVLRGVVGRDLNFQAQDGTPIHGWWYEGPSTPSGPAPSVLFLHGNAGHIGHRADLADGLLGEGVSILLLEYRGYGRSGGRPSEEGLSLDAAAGHAFLAEIAGGANRIVVLGRSMGGAVAAQLASTHPVGGLVLESAFTSLEAMAETVYPFLPKALFRRLRGHYSTLDGIRRYGGPFMVVHGTEDDLVPLSMGIALYDAGGPDAEWVGIRGAGHNDVSLVGGRAYFQRVAAFCRRVVSQPEGRGP